MATWFEHRVVAACSLCEMAHMYAICSLFAYAAFYVVDSGWASDRDAAGFVAGLLGSAVTLGRIPVAALWGAAARMPPRMPVPALVRGTWARALV